MESIFIGLIPTMLWGFLPIIMQKIGGKPANQMIGLTLGTLLFATIVVIIRPPFEWSMTLIVASFVCGVAWSIAQFGQTSAFPLIGVSRAIPISTGLQLIGSSLVGIFYFHEWNTFFQILLGLGAITLIIIGVSLTTYQEKQQTHNRENMSKGLQILVLTGAFYIVWIAVPRMANLDGWDVVFPQAVGAFLGTFSICLIKKKKDIWNKVSFKNMLTGFFFFGGNLVMMLSNQINGIAVGFTLAQMCVVIASIGGILILKEHKTTKEFKTLLIGLLLVVLGGIMIGMTKL